jgi:FdhD protein
MPPAVQMLQPSETDGRPAGDQDSLRPPKRLFRAGRGERPQTEIGEDRVGTTLDQGQHGQVVLVGRSHRVLLRNLHAPSIAHMGRVTGRRPVLRLDLASGSATRRPDTLAAEEPLEIRVNGEPLAVTMRTPGDDVDLAHGFLLTEGIVRTADDITTARFCDGTDDAGANTYNVLDLALAEGVPPPAAATERRFYTTSSCGVCGKASIEAVRTITAYPIEPGLSTVNPQVLKDLPAGLRAAQRVFDKTGGLHAAGLSTVDGKMLAVREDVGRHNAVDKVLGWAVRERILPLASHILVVSGRASFELVQKASMAGIATLAAVSAPSTLAVDLAAESGMTLVGFLRGSTMNVYTGADRLRL